MHEPQLADLLLFERLVDGALAPEDMAAVEARLQDPSFRAWYLDQMVVSAVLERQFPAAAAPAPRPEKAPLFPAAAVTPTHVHWGAPVKNFLLRPHVFSLVFAAICIVSFLLTTAQIRRQPRTNIAEASAERQRFAAQLLRTEDAVWAHPAAAPASGHHLPIGETLTLERGAAEVRCYGGARVLLEGPAELRLLTRNAVQLSRGSLTARTPTHAAGFAVHTPLAQVVDLGTEFGVKVAERGLEVHVFTGKVELQPHDAESPPIPLEAGRAAAWTPDGGKKLTAAAPARFRRALAPQLSTLPQENIALGKPIVAASGSWAFDGLGSPDRRYVPDRVVDGVTNDEVGTYWLGREARHEEWFVIDLQQIYPLQRVELVNTHNFYNGDRATKDCEVWVASAMADGELVAPQRLRETILPNASGAGPNLPVHTLHFWTPDSQSPPPAGRYVKFVAKTYYGAGAGLNELRVFALPEASLTTVDPKTSTSDQPLPTSTQP